jgi:hypothetical protein
MPSIYQHYLDNYSNGKLPRTTLDDLTDELEKINQEKKYKIVISKNYTSKEQSEMLIKLGIPIDTADMWYGVTYKKIGREDDDFGESIEYIELSKYPDIKETAYTKKGIPAWSLSALLELIPESIDDNTDDFSQLQLTKKSVAYYYGDGALRCGFLKDNFINAVFEMICWLKENNKI